MEKMKRTYISPKIEVLSPIAEHSVLGFIVTSHSIEEGLAKPQNNFCGDADDEEMLQEGFVMDSLWEEQP